MKNFIFLTVLSMVNCAANASTITAIANGPWLSTSTWSCTCLPSNTDDIVIPSAFNVTINIPGVSLDLGPVIHVTISGTLTINSSALFVDATDIVRINNGGSIKAVGLGGSVFSGLTNIGLSPGSQITGPETITNGTLPITLLFFKAQQDESGVTLSWASATEKNFDYYSLDRSSEGEEFRSIAMLKGAGTSVTEKHYSYRDSDPSAGKLNYRLRAMDNDGSEATYNSASVDFASAVAFSISPNPVINKKVVFDFSSHPSQGDYFVVRSTNGAIVLKSELKEGKNEADLSTSTQRGIYVIQVITATRILSQRAVVE